MENQSEEKLTLSSIKSGLSIIWRYMKMYKSSVVTLSVLGVLSALGNGIVPLLIGRFFDAIVAEPGEVWGISSVVFFLGLWLTIQLVTSLIDWYSSFKSEVLSNSIWGKYLSECFYRIWELPMSYHKKQKAGEASNAINTAANYIETIAGRIIIDLSPQFLSIFVAIGVTLFMSSLLASVLFLGVVIYSFILMAKVAPLAKIQKEYYELISFLWGGMYDSTSNIQTIKQATTEEFEKEQLAEKFSKGISKWYQMSRIWSDVALVQKIIILTTQVIIFATSIFMIRNGEMTLGELIAFNSYAALIFGPFVTLARNWQYIQNGIVSLNVAEKIISVPSEVYDPQGGISEGRIEGNIKFENIHFSYDEKNPVLKNISFEVKAGEKVALVGESGVGKSTFIDLISAYHFPTSGRVLIDGVDIHRYNLRFLRRQIATVPQEVVLFNDTVKHNIKYGNFESSDSEIEEAARKAYAMDFIEKFADKWDQIVGERGVKLSVGQKQRIAIARAILRNPRILILDEPTSALDAGSENIITKSLESLMEGKTTFIIAHRLSTVRKADKILVFKDGEVIESGKHDELLQIEGGEYRRLYELQIGLHE